MFTCHERHEEGGRQVAEQRLRAHRREVGRQHLREADQRHQPLERFRPGALVLLDPAHERGEGHLLAALERVALEQRADGVLGEVEELRLLRHALEVFACLCSRCF